MKKKLEDPVAKVVAEKDELTPAVMETSMGELVQPPAVKQEDDLLEGLKLSDLTMVSSKVTKGGNPFDGYPVEKIKIGMDKGKPVMIPKHSIVFLSADTQVVQDPSGMGRTRTKKDGAIEKVNFQTFHSRIVVDSKKDNIDVVFDRVVIIEGKPVYYAIIHDHTARSQIIFKIKKGDKKTSWTVDNRYKLLDGRQSSRLSSIFKLFFAQQFRGEQKAEFHETYKES